MSIFHARRVVTSPIRIPDDRAEAHAITAAAVSSEAASVELSHAQQSWFSRSVQPMLDELKLRREQNGFGQEFELSIMPRDRG